MIDTYQIRCQIIHLALSGKLTTHENDDGTANSIIESIGRNKKTQDIIYPFDLPKYWCWVKLSDLYEINPKVVAEDSMEAAFIPMEKISPGFENAFSYEIQKWGKASKNHTKFSDGDVAFAKISPCFENRKSFVADTLPNTIGGGTTELIILRQKHMYSKYTYYVISDQRFIKEGSSSYKGIVGQQRVKTDIIKNYMVPVPPYKEQIRIVDKIESIFAVLDLIDTLQQKYAADAEILKSKLIDAAIQGKLTEQLPSDGTAEELYQQIQTEKQALISAGKIKKEKPLKEIAEDEIPFEIPESWKWVRFGDISYIERGGSPRPIKQYLTDDVNGINWIKIGDVEKGGKYIFKTKEKIKPEGEKKSRRVYPDDFLLTNSMSFGRPYISKIEGCVHDGWLIIRNLGGVSADYLYYLLSAKFLYEQFCQKASGSTVSNLNIEKVNSAIIPLPPIKEQERIANRIEELLKECN